MTHLCYTLEEAAVKLSLTEPVLVRLSQYFREPKAAYEETGYLSFKGDLTFEESDLAFFRWIRERLLAGRSLEAIRKELQEIGPSERMGKMKLREKPSLTGGSSDGKPGIQEITDERPYEKAVEKSFARYKSIHHPDGGKVFENLLRGIRPADSSEKGPAVHPLEEQTGLRGALRQYLASDAEARTTHESERITPPPQSAPQAAFETPPDDVAEATAPEPAEPIKLADTAWDTVIQQAVQNPRSLNTHLKNAALLLREKVTRRHAMMPNASRMRNFKDI